MSLEPFHLFRYLDEQSFRFNERGGNGASRFVLALAGIVHKAPHLQGAHRLGIAANVLKKPSDKNREAIDVPADNPKGTMDRFTSGLRQVIAARKPDNKNHSYTPRSVNLFCLRPLVIALSIL